MVKEPLPGFDLPAPACEVDRAFIVILGGPDMDRMQQHYHRHYGVPEADVMEARVSVLSNALGLPSEQLHPIAALSLVGQSLIEVDVYPSATTARARVEGGLPPAMAVVSFAADRLPDHAGKTSFTDEPYRHRPSVLDHGAAGEMVELIGI
jgi:hypothetical protein